MTTTIKHPDHARRHAGAMDDTAPPDPEVPERSLGRRQFSAKYKAKVLAEYDTLPRSARGALLRREGLYHSHVQQWREAIDKGTLPALSGKPAGRPARSQAEVDNERLRKENEKLSTELARTRAALEVVGKAHALLELLSESADSGTKREK